MPSQPASFGFDATLGDEGDGGVLEMRPITPLDGGAEPQAKGGRQPFASQIPWNLLDDLEAEKTRMAETGHAEPPKFARSPPRDGGSGSPTSGGGAGSERKPGRAPGSAPGSARAGSGSGRSGASAAAKGTARSGASAATKGTARSGASGAKGTARSGAASRR